LEEDSNYIEKYIRLLLATNDNEDEGERNEVGVVIVKKGRGIKGLSVCKGISYIILWLSRADSVLRESRA